MTANNEHSLPCEDDSDEFAMKRMTDFLDMVAPNHEKAPLPSMDTLVNIIVGNIRRLVIPHIEARDTEFYLYSTDMEVGIPSVGGWPFVPHKAYENALNLLEKELLASHNIELILEGCDGGSAAEIVYLDDVEARKEYIANDPYFGSRPEEGLKAFQAGVVKIQADLDSMSPGEEKKLDMEATWGGTSYMQQIYYPHELATLLVGGTMKLQDDEWFYRKD